MTKIDVTQDCIDHGVRQDCSLCPVARAVQSIFPDKIIGVYSDEVVVCDTQHQWEVYHYKGTGDYTAWAAMPQTGEQFVMEFDDENAVEPLTLELQFYNWDGDEINP